MDCGNICCQYDVLYILCFIYGVELMDKQEIITKAIGKFRGSLLKLNLDPKESWAQMFETDIVPTLEKAIGEAIDEAVIPNEKPRNDQNEGDYPEEMGKPFYSDTDLFPFGKYGPPPKGSGSVFKDVPRSYLEWLLTQDWIGKWTGVVRYIKGEKTPPDAGASEDPFGSTIEGYDGEEAPF
jgi:hypothetical protein